MTIILKKMNEILKKRIEEAANDKYTDNTFAYKGFIDGAEYALSNQWISVEEAMPEANENVLALIGSVPVVVKGYHVRARLRDITHWMPIPKFETKK